MLGMFRAGTDPSADRLFLCKVKFRLQAHVSCRQSDRLSERLRDQLQLPDRGLCRQGSRTVHQVAWAGAPGWAAGALAVPRTCPAWQLQLSP